MRVALAAGICVAVAGCGSGDASSGSTNSGESQKYELLLDFYADESGVAVDPMTFVGAPGAEAGTGALNVNHVAGITAAPRGTNSAAPLLGADGSELEITFGQWQQAQGTVTFRCVDSTEEATSKLSGLIPSGVYSTFAVHTDLKGPGRFTPWGAPAGTTNNFTASKDGTATRTDSVTGCTGEADDIVIVWHSDGQTHGGSPGTIGADWHTSLISRVA